MMWWKLRMEKHASGPSSAEITRLHGLLVSYLSQSFERARGYKSCYQMATDITDAEPANAKGVVSPTGFEGFCQVGTDSWGIQFQGSVKAA
jgi:hypothetical protein